MKYEEFTPVVTQAGELAAVGETLIARLHASIKGHLPGWSVLPSFAPHRLDVDFWGLRLVFRVSIQLEKEAGKALRGVISAHTLSYGDQPKEEYCSWRDAQV